MGWYNFGPYISVAEKKAKAEKLIKKLKQERPDLQPVCVSGRTISRSFWGQAWGKHLETYADHENRIGRGRSYVRNSAVCHLEAEAGRLRAIVAGSYGDPYEVTVTVRPLSDSKWKALKAASAGRIASMLDLLSGRFPKDIMARAADPEEGLFPKLGELKFACTCPDWAQMCKHVAAALYAFGQRLDSRPELLFLLRGVDPAELLNLATLARSATAGTDGESLADDVLSGIFGIELDLGGMEPRKAVKKPPRARKQAETPGNARALAAAPDSPPAFKNQDRPKGREIAALRHRLKMTVAEFAAA